MLSEMTITLVSTLDNAIVKIENSSSFVVVKEHEEISLVLVSKLLHCCLTCTVPCGCHLNNIKQKVSGKLSGRKVVSSLSQL